MNYDIYPLKADNFIKSALEYMEPYKGAYIYNVFARDFREKTDQVDAGYGRWLYNLLSYLIKQYSLSEKPRILDFGCGTGELTVRMASLGFDTTGIDTNEEHLKLAMALAKENNLSNVNFILNKENHLPFDDNSFDIITMFSVFEHLNDETLRWFLPELNRICRGIIYILVPNKLKTRDDHTGLLFVPWLPNWLVTPYVKICGRSHSSSMSESGTWDVYYRSFSRIAPLFKQNSFNLEFPPNDTIYPPLDKVPPIFRIGKKLKLGMKTFFIGLPLPWKTMAKFGYPKEAFYPYLNLIFVSEKKCKSYIPLGDRVILGERVDIKFEKDIRTKYEHLWRYRFALKRAKGKILDIGCGTGYGSGLLHDAGNDVYSIDVSRKAITYAEKSYPGPHYFCCNGEKLSFANESFDAVTAFEVIEHMPDPHKVLSEIYRILKRGGNLFISTPNPRFLGKILKHVIFGKPYPEKLDPSNIYHIKEFCYEEFLKLLQMNGFRARSKYGQTIPRLPTFYRINFDLGRFFPRYAWTVVVHAVKGE